jgi:hypothetical protein
MKALLTDKPESENEEKTKKSSLGYSRPYPNKNVINVNKLPNVLNSELRASVS